MNRQALMCVVIVALLSAACDDHSPASQFHSCVLAGVETIKHGGQAQAQVNCALPADVVVVGRPRGQVNKAELIKSGVSTNVADMLAGSRESAQWCVVEDYGPQPIPRDVDHANVLLAKSECVDTDVQIPRALRAKSSSIDVTLGISASGTITLINFEPR